jgi:hypothetical protein
MTPHCRNGAYTELFAAFSPELNEKNSGAWGKSAMLARYLVTFVLFADIHGLTVAPFGKIETGRKDLNDAALQKKYWVWTEGQLQSYMQ